MLSYVFSIQGFVLSLQGLVLAFLFGAVLAYFTNISPKTLYRIPYLFMFACAFLGYVLLSYAINLVLFRLNGALPPVFMALFAAVAPFLFGYLTMYLSVSRARDGFGKKGAAWLLVIPLLNLGLFIVTLDDNPEDREEKNQPEPAWNAGIHEWCNRYHRCNTYFRVKLYCRNDVDYLSEP